MATFTPSVYDINIYTHDGNKLIGAIPVGDIYGNIITITTEGLSTNNYSYTYSGSAKFIGVTTTPNGNLIYKIGDTFTPSENTVIYIIEEELLSTIFTNTNELQNILDIVNSF